MLTDLLFQSPWWLPVTFIVIGIFVFMTGNRRQERRVVLAGAGIVLLGVALGLTSYLVETDEEMAIHRTEALVAAVNARDWSRFSSLLDPETTVGTWRGPKEITDAAQSAAARFNLGRVRMSGKNVEVRETVITITIRVFSDIYGQNFPSDWMFQYQNLGRGWVLYSVEPSPTGGPDGDLVRDWVQRH